MPRHTIHTCPNASLCSEPSEARIARAPTTAMHGEARQFLGQWRGRIALQAGHASPVEWCLNEKVELLCSFLADRRCRFLDTVPLAKRCLGAGS